MSQDIMGTLQLFFESPELIDAVTTFMHDTLWEKQVFAGGVDVEKEQPHEYHDAYKDYLSLFEAQLSKFLATKGISHDDLADPAAVECVDYVISSSSYPEFLALVRHYQHMFAEQDDD
eukprot:NODE_2506_length_685_cov_59.682390_g2049_i0.p1 GENE.NODE_2506_length_685_cov_59.682390_g2049_i0~~NODE_2506_length_685_cov_59.682390_g2049_i0.p1  ORF type:complete len:135 (+),score=32.76 NODE_2506_length_685_cov_59.682390_g2049_i0:54-407(+)